MTHGRLISYIVKYLVYLLGATLLLILLICASLASIALYRLYLHPLAGVPGPKAAAVSNFWYANRVINGGLYELGKHLHKQYGPVVRVGPNEVWFNSKEAFKVIYSAGSGYGKSDFYLATSLQKPTLDWRLRPHFADTLDFLSERDTARYRLQRRLTGRTYQAANLRRFEPAVDDVLRRAVARLGTLRAGHTALEVDLKEWMHALAVECLGAVVLSWSPGYLRDGSDGGTSAHSYQGWRRKSLFGLFPGMYVAELVSKSLARPFANLWGVTYPTPKGFKNFFTPVYRKVSRRIAVALHPQDNNLRNPSKPPKPSRTKATPPPPPPADLLSDLIALHQEKPAFTETYLHRLAITNFGAGHETMCSALTASMAMIASHPDALRRATAELRDDSSRQDRDDGGVVSYDTATKSLPYTSAAIRESQRLHPVIGMSLPRTVPAQGPALRLHGHTFPPGTTVGCNPASLHRNPSVYGPDAEDFRPERWLPRSEADGADEEAERDRLRAMDRYNLTWGGGARVCPGRHLAELVVWKAVPTLLREFDVEITRMPADGEVRYYFLAMLTGVKARFLPRKEEKEDKSKGG